MEKWFNIIILESIERKKGKLMNFCLFLREKKRKSNFN